MASIKITVYLQLLPIPDAIPAHLVTMKRVTPESHWQDVRHLTFSTPTSHMPQYSPGDIITIYPQNFSVDVQELIDIMSWNEVADQPLRFEGDIPKRLHAMPKTTLRQLLTANLDITVSYDILATSTELT